MVPRAGEAARAGRGHRREQVEGEDEVPVMPVLLLAAAGSA